MGLLDGLFKPKTQQLAYNYVATDLPVKYKTRFAMLGTVGSGKSTVTAAIFLTAQTLSGHPEFRNFYTETLEGSTSSILDDVSRLRRGHFPEKTQKYLAAPPEAGLGLTWGGRFGDKRVQIPICDIAGEDVQQMIRQSRIALNPDQYNDNVQLINYVRDADGFILVVPASRALMFADDVAIESEYDVHGNVSDPDVPLQRILNEIFRYKQQTRGKRVKGIAVVITKWDLIAPFAARLGMDIGTPDGLYKFMHTCFPGTSSALKRFIDKGMVQFFPSAIKVMLNADGTKRKWPGTDNDRIEVRQDERKPVYEEQSYVRLFLWLKSFAV
jgi:GTPase SAR1 family protein